jgi:hypothetical protein
MSRVIKFRMWSTEPSKMFYDTEIVMECLKQQLKYNDLLEYYQK